MCVVIVVARRSFYTLSSTAHKSKHQVVPLKRLKTKENYLTIIPEKWYQLLTRGGRLRQGPTLRL